MGEASLPHYGGSIEVVVLCIPDFYCYNCTHCERVTVSADTCVAVAADVEEDNEDYSPVLDPVLAPDLALVQIAAVDRKMDDLKVAVVVVEDGCLTWGKEVKEPLSLYW